MPPVLVPTNDKALIAQMDNPDYAGSRVLVTGADGFIGSHVTEALVRAGANVRAFVMYNSFGSRGWLDQTEPEIASAIDIFAGDIRDPNGVRQAMKGIDCVFHLAALIAIPFSYHSPDSYIDTNVKGTLNVLQAARDEGARMVNTSTSEIYGTAQYVPIDEAHPPRPQSPYAASKLAADHLVDSFHRSFAQPVTTARFFNNYGPRQSMRAVIPTILTQLLRGQKEIRLGATHPTRDFTYVEDTARGFLAIGKCDAAIGEVVNMGSGFEISIQETAELIAEVLGTEIEIISEDLRMRPEKSEVERLFAGTAKAEALLDWRPEHKGREGFKAGIRKTAEWFSKPANLAFFPRSDFVL